MSKPTYIEISAKCSDRCHAELQDKDGNILQIRDGYVPDFFPDKRCGAYIRLKIDLRTGKIVNWRTPTDQELGRAFNCSD